jgi:DAK2 domain fusion protein YloV
VAEALEARIGEKQVEEKITDSSRSSSPEFGESSAGKQDGSLPRGSILAIDGQGLKRLVEAGLAWLRHHQSAINALNVFPVPDGDTGTNMLLTMQSAWAEIVESPEQNAGIVAQAIAHGALMGARGNSGVILSQLWRGFARSMDNKQTFAAADLAEAMQEASDTAYKGVIKPVEGTILTVAREAADAANQVTREYGDLVTVLDYIVGQARQAVARTPSQLAVLAEAGVVDAGGQGLYTILEGMLRYLHGETIQVDEALDSAVDLKAVPITVSPEFGAFGPGVPEPAHAGGEVGYGYDVQFIIVGHGLDVSRIRREVDAMGDSTLVVGDVDKVKVHVHVPDPGVPISYAVKWGSLRDVVVEDMQSQYQEFILGRSAPPVMAPKLPHSEVSTVAVVPGQGLALVFESLGVGQVISGGQTMNPSTQQLLEAVEELPAKKLIILPNNSNIVMAAQQAAELSSKEVIVVPTRTVPQGISALLAFNYQADLKTNVDLMRAALNEVESGEITTATRSVELDGVQVKEGEIIGLVNERLVASGPTIEQVLWPMMDQMALAEREILTLYYGNGVTPEQVEHLAAKISERYPDQEIELVEGGQPYYHYIISVE